MKLVEHLDQVDLVLFENVGLHNHVVNVYLDISSYLLSKYLIH